MLISRQRLDEEVHYIICLRQIVQSDSSRCKSLTHEVLADVNIFCTIVKLWVIGKLNRSLIV